MENADAQSTARLTEPARQPESSRGSDACLPSFRGRDSPLPVSVNLCCTPPTCTSLVSSDGHQAAERPRAPPASLQVHFHDRQNKTTNFRNDKQYEHETRERVCIGNRLHERLGSVMNFNLAAALFRVITASSSSSTRLATRRLVPLHWFCSISKLARPRLVLVFAEVINY